MAKDLIPPPPDDDESQNNDDEFEGMTDEDLQDSIRNRLSLSLESLLWAARAINYLERNGRSLGSLTELPIISWLRRIGSGVLAAEAYRRFCNKPALLQIVVRLPPQDQRRLASE